MLRSGARFSPQTAPQCASPSPSSQTGFTLVEILVVLLLAGIVSTALFTFSNTSVNQYLALQQDGMVFGDLASQSQRVAKVLRGLTDITSASANDISAYAYFAPTDNYVSLIHYYLSPDNTILMADVTPYDANPPIGNPITANKKTYKIITSFYLASGTSTFVYLDSAGGILPTPITDLHTIKGITINLAVASKTPSVTGNDAISLQVSLRNRKTNL